MMFRWGQSRPHEKRCVFFVRVQQVRLCQYGSREFKRCYKVENTVRTCLLVRVKGSFSRILLGPCLHIVLDGQDLERGVHDPSVLWNKISEQARNASTELAGGYLSSTVVVNDRGDVTRFKGIFTGPL